MLNTARLHDAIKASFRNVHFSAVPFPHATTDHVLDDETAILLLDWLQQKAPWGLESSSFYIQHGCSLDRGVDADVVGLICSRDITELLTARMGSVFGTIFNSAKTSVSAHRLIPGHRIGMHTDCPRDGTETHRLIIHLTHSLGEDSGGELALFDREDPANSLVVIPARHNSSAMIQFSSRSWHTVEEVRQGVRYSLLYSFWVDHPTSPASDLPGERQLSQPFDEQYSSAIELLGALPFAAKAHSGRTFAHHLIGTANILKEWFVDKDVCLAGLFHNIFGTLSVKPPSIDSDDMARIKRLIGERALSLIEISRRLTAHDLRRVCSARELDAGTSTVKLQGRDVTALVLLYWSNLLEQASHHVSTADERKALSELLACCSPHIPEYVTGDIRRTLF